jgi:hypothetical protein
MEQSRKIGVLIHAIATDKKLSKPSWAHFTLEKYGDTVIFWAAAQQPIVIFNP